MGEEGLRCLARARAHRALVSRAALPAMLPLWEAGHTLRAAARDPRKVGQGALAPAPVHSRAMLIARAMSGRW